MTGHSWLPSLAVGALAPRTQLRHKVIGTPLWTEVVVAMRSFSRRSADPPQPKHPTHRGRPDFLFEEAATAREMYRL
ncbi:hypothetical protein [Mycobacterium sp. 360MFTsu5.1]|uniref:hypothetical protein n=1 Tax=Mycobacterium sp. 360MFTsu5.1 TaxID=1172186 RepID=UPI0012DE19FD|nr:hypothetical protein [Mycobacterium sp. 360MFTsu5.1]